MVETSRRALELNELTWWSRWASLRWLDRNSHILTSLEFGEPFFNRAGFLECRDIAGSLGAVEARFRELGADPTLLLYDSCSSGMKALTSSGYGVVDRMTVMDLVRPSFRQNGSLLVRQIPAGGEAKWSQAYLLSFYGDTRLLPSVTRVVAQLTRMKGITLLEGMVGEEVGGVLAIQRSKNLAGVYCIGTVPRFRRTGVSGTLISWAYEIAAREGRRLFLQSLESDGAERFYLRGGFRKLYTKNILSRRLRS